MTVKATDVLKAYFPLPEDDSPQSQAILHLRHENASMRRRYNLLALHVLRGIGHPAGTPHEDNCGRPCRFDPLGHDCCAICNDGEATLQASTPPASEKP